MSWSQVTEAAKSWSQQTEAAKTWTGDNRSHTTNRNNSRFIALTGSADGAGGVDFVYRIVASNVDRHRFFIENGAPISLRSTHNNPLSPA